MIEISINGKVIYKTLKKKFNLKFKENKIYVNGILCRPIDDELIANLTADTVKKRLHLKQQLERNQPKRRW